MQTWLFVLMAVSNQPSDEMDDKIGWAAVTRMLNLRDILDLVDDRLNDGPFAEQQLIGKEHEGILHILAQSRDKMKSLFKEQLAQRSGNRTVISKELPAQSSHHLRNRSSIINVARGQTTRQQVAAIIDRQMQLEAINPAHATLSTFGVGGKDTMLVDALKNFFSSVCSI